MLPVFALVVSDLQLTVMFVLFLASAVDELNSGFCSGFSTSATPQISGDDLGQIVDLSGNDSDVCRDNSDENTMPVAVEVEEENWSCSRCTFLNHPLLNTCECCSFERQSEPSE